MNYIKKYSKILIIMFLIILVTTFFITLLNYFDILGRSLTVIFKILIILISMFTGGYIVGMKCKNKGYLEGLKLGVIFSIILFIFTLIFGDFKITNIFYYLILIISTIFGSMIGINKNKE